MSRLSHLEGCYWHLEGLRGKDVAKHSTMSRRAFHGKELSGAKCK